MTRMQRFTRRLLRLRNLAPLIIIIGAIVGTFGFTPFGIHFSTEQVILALLAFLAIDALVERLDLLASIEQDIQAVRETLTPKVGADAFLRKRRDFPRMEPLINEARDDIWVAGVTLDTMVTLVNTFESKLRQGCRLRFLALDPDGQDLGAAARYYATAPSFTSERIHSNLTVLASRLKPVDGSVEIRVLDRVFTTGYFITDPESRKAQMIVQLYLYHTDAEESPLFELSKANDTQWFSIFTHQFETAWDDAKEFFTLY